MIRGVVNMTSLRSRAKTLLGAAVYFCVAVLPSALFAYGVTRTVEPIQDGCRVTIAWDLSGKVESGLVIEERFATGWSVDDSTVPFASLDASWISGNVARFAVKPTLLAESGSISYTVLPGAKAVPGSVVGDWMMYLGGKLCKGKVQGEGIISFSSTTQGDEVAGAPAGNPGTSVTEKKVAIASFKILSSGVIEFFYRGGDGAGTLVVEGCEGLGKAWVEVGRYAVISGDGKVELGLDKAKDCQFFRMKLITEGK